MGRHYKRQRLSDPPEFVLHHRREQNDLRLKSTFESIFEKYGKDFDGIGDEIDLETGEIIVNNGHVLGMVNERDAGDLETDSGEEDSDDDWSDDDRVLASSLLLETRRRIDALGGGGVYEEEDFVDDELQSEDEADSLLGDNDSLMGDLEAQPTLPAVRTNFGSPDSLYDDEEDELASSEMEWPTPRKAWPTPSKATPLGHTPWHSSPLKPVYKSDISVDPAWRAPPLPTDGEQRQHSRPAGLTKRREAKDFSINHSIQYNPLRASEPRTPLQQKTSFTSSLGHMRSLNRRRASDGPETIALLRNAESMRAPRWTRAEEKRLRRLRTTTTLMYREMKPYFPGRKTQAIMIHWSEMTRKGRARELSHKLPRSGSSVLSSRRKSSPNRESYKMPEDASPGNLVSNRVKPTTKPAAVGSVDARASNGPDLVPHRAISHHGIKRESTPPYFNFEIPNTSDPTEQSQGIQSSSPASFACPRAPWSAEHRKSPYNDVKKKEHELQTFMTTPPLPDDENAFCADTELPDDADGALQLSPQSSIIEASQSRSTKSSSKEGCASRGTSSTTPSIGRASSSQSHQAYSLNRTVQLPSYQSDDSDDELSAPIKTVGLRKSHFQRASTSTLSDIVLYRGNSSVSRRG